MSNILNVLKPLDGSCTTTDRRRRLIASVCRLIGEELAASTRRARPAGATARAPRGAANSNHPRAALERVPRSSNGDAVVSYQAGPAPLVLQLDVATDGQLSPRLQQTLQSLLSGDSEKQVARKLGLSPHTVHVYVKKLYRRYGVSSRGELLAKWVAR